MPTKEELSGEINQKLGTDMEWERMKKDDLELLNELIDGGALMETMAKQYLKDKGEKKLDEQIDDWHPGKIATKLL